MVLGAVGGPQPLVAEIAEELHAPDVGLDVVLGVLLGPGLLPTLRAAPPPLQLPIDEVHLPPYLLDWDPHHRDILHSRTLTLS